MCSSCEHKCVESAGSVIKDTISNNAARYSKDHAARLSQDDRKRYIIYVCTLLQVLPMESTIGKYVTRKI